MIGLPVLLANGHFEIYHQFVVENNGETDLADASSVFDLQKQLDSKVLIGVNDLTIVTPPTSPNSSIAINSLGWDGTSATNLFDQSATTNFLSGGDSFVIGFKAEIDALTAAGVLRNKVTVSGTAVPNLPVVPSVCLTKTDSGPIANGDNWDVTFTLALKNSGAIALDRVEVFDDLAASFGGQFAGVTLDRVTSGSGNTGAALVANSGFAADTSLSLVKSTGPVEIGDAFEIVFTVTIDPNADGTAASGLESQSSAICESVDQNGHVIVNLERSRALSQSDSDSGKMPAGNSDCEVDRTFADQPPQVAITDVAVVKSAVGNPIPLTNGNFEVVYDLVVTNKGNVDLRELTLVEDLAGRFDSVLVKAGNVTLFVPPSEPRSLVTLENSWNGDTLSEMIDQAAPALLVVGDSFTVQFTVEVDPRAGAASSKPESRIAVSGKEVQVIEEGLSNSNDGKILAADLLEAEGNLTASGRDNPIDQEMVSDLVMLDGPNLAIDKALVGGPVLTDLGNYVLTCQLIVRNTGNVDLANLSLLENLIGQFGRSFVKAGNLLLSSTPSDAGSSISVDSASWNGKIATELLDSAAANVLVNGDSFTVQFEVEINPSRMIAPPENPLLDSDDAANVNIDQLNPVDPVSIDSLIDGFTSAPGPIYSGTPINQNPKPLPLDKGPVGAAGYSLSDGSIFAGI